MGDKDNGYTGVLDITTNTINIENEFTKDNLTEAFVTRLYCRYPMKLIVSNLAYSIFSKIVYILSYGGGLVQGDRTKLKINIDNGANLTVLTQGNTKVYKTQVNSGIRIIEQKVDVFINPNSSCVYFVEPVMCYRFSFFFQAQTFHLSNNTSSLLLIDWVISGRNNEEWLFELYRSNNLIYRDGKLIFRDNTCLTPYDTIKNNRIEDENGKNGLSDKIYGFSIYGILVLIGPRFNLVSAAFIEEFNLLQIDSKLVDRDLIWSCSHLKDVDLVIIRFCAKEVHDIKEFIFPRLASISHLINLSNLF